MRLAPAEEEEDRERASSSRCMFCEVVDDDAAVLLVVAATPVTAARRSVGARDARRDIIVSNITEVIIIYLCTEEIKIIRSIVSFGKQQIGCLQAASSFG